MPKVMLHLYDAKGAEPENPTVELGRVPAIGELLVLVADQRHFSVAQVIHCVGGQHSAEVWCHRLSESETKKALKHGVWRRGPGVVFDPG